MGLYQAVLRKLLFRLDAETAHHLGLWVVSRGLLAARPLRDPRLEVEAMGIRFPNPIGLAAGFDKDAVAINQWWRAGFGFVEVGTLTPRPQPGNPKPRLFRLPADQGLINRLGFNNQGASAAAARLRTNRAGIPIGVNIGKNKDTPLEQAHEDYRVAAEALRGLGSYVVVNVSSPNTPGLRQLQDADSLRQILRVVREVDPVTPLLVKVAPDLEFDTLDELCATALDCQVDGLIATNTTLSREGLRTKIDEAGGLSGRPVAARSDAVLQHLGRTVGDRLTLIGVGGIFNADDVRRKRDLGAKLVQMYTGWVYGGPGTVPWILADLLS